jgi:flavin-dependent dehydrogenase
VSAITALEDRYDVAVVGAGPAGLAAATVAAAAGLSTVVLDENPGVGG